MLTAKYVSQLVQNALAEDIGSGDITSALVSSSTFANANIVTRESGVLCGKDFAEQAFQQVDPKCKLTWFAEDGDRLEAGGRLCLIKGPARALLTAERTALNFLQLLSGTASSSRQYADRVAHTSVRLLDTRKTLPGLRLAQKYAVSCGGCHNHRTGLFDAFLIKENHIAACGGIHSAIAEAKRVASDIMVEVEVESLDEMESAVQAGADRIMLDNFDLKKLQEAVALNAGRAELEASGNITELSLIEIAETGIDLISVGALTKHIRALDLSMRMDSIFLVSGRSLVARDN